MMLSEGFFLCFKQTTLRMYKLITLYLWNCWSTFLLPRFKLIESMNCVLLISVCPGVITVPHIEKMLSKCFFDHMLPTLRCTLFSQFYTPPIGMCLTVDNGLSHCQPGLKIFNWYLLIKSRKHQTHNTKLLNLMEVWVANKLLKGYFP